jgi:hypothetical protein
VAGCAGAVRVRALGWAYGLGAAAGRCRMRCEVASLAR